MYRCYSNYTVSNIIEIRYWCGHVVKVIRTNQYTNFVAIPCPKNNVYLPKAIFILIIASWFCTILLIWWRDTWKRNIFQLMETGGKRYWNSASLIIVLPSELYKPHDCVTVNDKNCYVCVTLFTDNVLWNFR